MLLGFISLLLTIFQGPINHICIPESYTRHMLPCKRSETKEETGEAHSLHESPSKKIYSFIGSASRKLLSSGGEETTRYCEKQGKKPFVSTEGLHQLHIFIFVLAIVHVVYCVLTVLLGSAQIRIWKTWETKNKYNAEHVMNKGLSHVAQDDFVKTHADRTWKKSAIRSWVECFFKQFYGSVTKTDYSTLRMSFIETHFKSNPQFDFYKHMMRILEADFKKVVGISWYLWFFVVLFLLLNIDGWNTYFWIAFLPLILLLFVGAKLEHVIVELAQEVAEKHTAVKGPILVRPSDDHFWFRWPKLVLYLIHFILFQNAFEIAFFFWILTTYGFDSCIMGKVGYVIPRLVIGVVVQVLCSFSTLPLYALVTQMGTNTMYIFEEKETDRFDADSDREGVQMMKINGNGTSRVQSGTVHDETTEIAEAKIDMPRSSCI